MTNEPYFTVSDFVARTNRNLTPSQTNKVEILRTENSDILRQLFRNQNKDLDELIESGKVILSVVKGVAIMITARDLDKSDEASIDNDSEDIGTQYTAYPESKYIYPSELKILGLKRQAIYRINKETE